VGTNVVGSEVMIDIENRVLVEVISDSIVVGFEDENDAGKPGA